MYSKQGEAACANGGESQRFVVKEEEGGRKRESERGKTETSVSGASVREESNVFFLSLPPLVVGEWGGRLGVPPSFSPLAAPFLSPFLPVFLGGRVPNKMFGGSPLLLPIIRGSAEERERESPFGDF